MPIFEFKCSDCGEKFEKLIFSSDKNKVKCPKCNSENVNKVFSVFASKGVSKGISSCSAPSGFS